MEKTTKTFLTLFLLIMGTMMSWADFKNFSAVLNNQDGTLLTAEEQVQGTAVSFGVAVDDAGNTTRVAADDATAVATISGKYHNEHGMTNLTVTVPVDGNVKILVGQCTYGGHTITVKNTAGDVVVQKEGGAACWMNDRANVTEVLYAGEATTLTVSGMGYCPYIAVEKNDNPVTRYDITYSLGEETATGTVPANVTWTEGDTYNVPKNFTLYKEGYTLTGWTDGSNTVKPGEAYTPAADVTLTPVFTQNTKTLADRKEPLTLKWSFRRDEGAPTIAVEGSGNGIGVWVTQATVDGETIDVKMDYDATSGKINNANNTDWAQMNNGTKLTIPSAKGALVSMEAYNEISTTTIDGQKDYTNGKTISYNIANTAEAIDIVIGDGSYYRYIQTVLPLVQEEAGGKTYTNEPVSAVWPLNDATTSNTKKPEDAFATVAMDLGDNVKMAGTGTGQATYPNGDKVVMTQFKPANGASDTFTANVKPAAGLTFTPTKFSCYIARFGTDAQSGVNVTAKANNETIKLGTYTAPRNNKTQAEDKFGSSADYTNQIVIELTEEQQAKLATTEMFTVSLTVGVGNTKTAGFGELTIEGKVNGTIATVNKYTVGIEASPAEGGEVSIYPKSDEYIENDEVTLTATEAFGYDFVNWTDKAGNEVSAEAKFKYTVTADETLTANFKKVNTYALDIQVEGGANDYMVSLSPEPTVVDGKKMYEEGTNVSISASSNDILTFTNWSDGQTSSDIKKAMTEDVSLTANYSAKDYIVGWDFYKAGGNGRVADFHSNADNEAAALVLINEAGETQGWLDKSTVAAGGYESMTGAAVNWKKLGEYYYQTKFNAKDFANIQVKSQLLCNYNAYSRVVLQYSLDGTEWKDAGEANLASTKVIYDLNATLPAECDHAEAISIRWKPDLTSSVTGTTAPDNDGTAISNIFVLAEAAVFDDGKAPVVTNTVPANDANNASANGRIVLTFDKKVQLTAAAKATLNGEAIELTASGKTILAQYKGLTYSTQYTFILNAGSVADLSGNNVLDENVTVNFTTMTKPVVAKALYDFIVPDYGTFKEALAAAASRADNSKRYRIFVKQGDYIIPANENTMVTGSDGKSYPDPKTSFGSPNVSIIGEGMDNTSISNTMPNDLASNPDAGADGKANPLEGIRESGVLYLTKTATDTYFEDITLKTNTPDATGRNVILVDGGNRTICKDVCLWAFQDTYVSDREQSLYYFEGGMLRGSTDFICGSGDVFFNGTTIQMCRKGGYIVAPRANVQYGYVFNDCTIKGETDGINGAYFLGRPWTEAAETYYINTKMEAIPSAAGWANMADGGCTRMAEYNSVSASGTPIDLSSRLTVLGSTTPNPNKPILTAEEAAEIGNLHNMFGDWDPTIYTEQASAPANVTLNTDTKVITWDSNDYVLLWAVCKDGKAVAFTTEPTYTVDDTSATWTVRAANEMGGLGEATTATVITGVDEVKAGTTTAGGATYNLAGQRVNDSYKGTVIKNSVKFIK